jgi:putative acetyltransferase
VAVSPIIPVAAILHRRDDATDDQGIMYEIREDDLSGAQTRALLALHLAGMHASSPPGSVFALDLSGLKQPGVTVWTAWRGDRVAGVGALKISEDGTAEVKSMRTHPEFLGMGAGSAILETIIENAAARGVRRLSLETGSGPAFEPALGLYRRRGFVNGEAFGAYTASEFNQFLHLELC